MHLVDGESLGLQTRGDGFGDGALVLDDQDTGLVAHPSSVGERVGGVGQML